MDQAPRGVGWVLFWVPRGHAPYFSHSNYFTPLTHYYTLDKLPHPHYIV